MNRLLFPGSFDPFTIGHKNIVDRALTMADEVIVAIGINAGKKGCFTPAQRKQQIERVYAQEPRVKVMTYEGLTTDFARVVGATALLRSVRTVRDLDYEQQLADINRMLTISDANPDGLETVLLLARPEFANISSSIVRELLAYGKDVSNFLP